VALKKGCFKARTIAYVFLVYRYSSQAKRRYAAKMPINKYKIMSQRIARRIKKPRKIARRKLVKEKGAKKRPL
jgi:hypothetical protein